jgi:hypothetical protein
LMPPMMPMTCKLPPTFVNHKRTILCSSLSIYVDKLFNKCPYERTAFVSCTQCFSHGYAVAILPYTAHATPQSAHRDAKKTAAGSSTTVTSFL